MLLQFNSLIAQLDFQQQHDFIIKLYKCYSLGDVSGIVGEDQSQNFAHVC